MKASKKAPPETLESLHEKLTEDLLTVATEGAMSSEHLDLSINLRTVKALESIAASLKVLAGPVSS